MFFRLMTIDIDRKGAREYPLAKGQEDRGSAGMKPDCFILCPGA